MKFTLAIALFTVAAAAGAQPADNEVINTTQPIAGVVQNPCSLEPVLFEGECHVLMHTRTSAGGSMVYTHTNCQGEGQGLLGNTYGFGSNSSSRSETSFACGTTQHFRQVMRFISPRSINNFFLYVTLVVTVDENCQPHVTVDEAEAECRGKRFVF